MAQISVSQPKSSHLKSVVARFLGGCIAVVAEIRDRMETRKSLDNLSPRYLRDIGLIESDIDSANSAPLSQEAATELKTKARVRSGNW